MPIRSALVASTGGITLAQFAVRLSIEAEDHAIALDQNRTLDQIGLRHHQVDRLFLRAREWTLLEHRATSAQEVEEMRGIHVFFEEGAARRVLVDVDLLKGDTLLVQKTSGIAAGRSRGFPIERRLRHRGTSSAL